MYAVEEQVKLASSPRYSYTLSMCHLWPGFAAPEESCRFGVAGETELAKIVPRRRRRVTESETSGMPE